MKSHHLGALIAAAVLAVVAGLWTSSVREPETNAAGTPLLPGLEEAVNDVTGVKLIGPGNETIATLSRGEQSWYLAEKSGHQANVSTVRELLIKLARAKLLEEKTSNPEYYARLGVEDIDAEDAGGVLVEFEGVVVPSVIVGNAEQAREAVYARRADESASWLASSSIVISKDIMQWLDRDVIDISASRIAEVEITHPDGEVVRISKAVFGQPNFDVAGIPSGRELKWATVANAMASVIEGLRVDDVLPFDESGLAEMTTTRAAFRAFDGYVVYADVAAKDDKYYAKFSAGTDAATAVRYLPGGDQEAEDESGAEADDMPDAETVAPGPIPDASKPAEADLSVVTEEAAKLNEALSGWVYLIPKFKYDQMTRRMTDLLQDPS